MNRDEIDTLLKAIKGTFPKIEFTAEMIREWSKRLSNYDFEDVEKNFNNYVLSGNTQQITIIDLIRDLDTKEKKEPLKGYFYCSRCKRVYESIEEADKCYERDLDISYIKRISDKLGVRYTEYFGNLYNATLDDINKNYDNFILRLVEEQKKNPVLRGYELEGLNCYYNQVILKKENQNE